MANKGEINISLVVKDDGSISVKRFADKSEDSIKGLARTITDKLGNAFDKMGSMARSSLNWVGNQLFSIKGLIASLGLGLLIKDTINVAASFDKMKLSLDTVTQGEGAEWFEKLNTWALKMPINTEKAIQSFIMMRAMGLKPTIDQMTTLVDTTSALGGEADMLEGIARALGQIQTKGKVSSEELMQLAERGIPVFEILKQKFGDVETSTLDASLAIQAIFEGLEERFGGQSAKIQNTWSGLMESLKSYWTEFQRLLMEAGVMDYLEDKLAGIVGWIDEMAASGALQEWATEAGAMVIEMFDKISTASKNTYEWVIEHWENVQAFFQFFKWVINGLSEAFQALGNWIGNTIAKFYTAYEKLANGEILGGLSELGKGVLNFTPRGIAEAAVPLDSYASGTPYVPRTGNYRLHEGERVVTREENRNYNNSLNLTINVPAGSRAADDPAELARYITRQQQRLNARGYAY